MTVLVKERISMTNLSDVEAHNSIDEDIAAPNLPLFYVNLRSACVRSK